MSETTNSQGATQDGAAPAPLATDAAKPAGTTPPAEAKQDPKAATTTAHADGKTEPKGDKPNDTDPAKAAQGQDIELKFPEGTTLDEGMTKAFKAFAKDNGITSAKAQAFADGFLKLNAEASKRFQQEQEAEREKWVEEIKADTDFGGPKLQQSLSMAAKAIDALGGKDVREILNRSGLGDHPAFLRMFARVGKAIAEDTIAGSRATPTDDPNAFLDALYNHPSSPKSK